MCFLIENMLNFSIIIHIYVVEDKQTLVSIQIYSITNDWINFIVMWLIFLEYFHPITGRMVSFRCKDQIGIYCADAVVSWEYGFMKRWFV